MEPRLLLSQFHGGGEQPAALPAEPAHAGFQKVVSSNPVPSTSSPTPPDDQQRIPTGRLQKFVTAELIWDHWETVSGRKTAVLRFNEVRGSDNKQPMGVSLSSGLVYCSADDGAIYRVVESQKPSRTVLWGSVAGVSEINFAPIIFSGKTYEFPTRLITISKVENVDPWFYKTTVVQFNFRENDSRPS